MPSGKTTFSGVFECRNDKRLPQMLKSDDRRNDSDLSGYSSFFNGGNVSDIKLFVNCADATHKKSRPDGRPYLWCFIPVCKW